MFFLQLSWLLLRDFCRRVPVILSARMLSFAALQLAFDAIALWALICKTHQQQNQSLLFSYSPQYIINKFSKFPSLNDLIRDSCSKQALVVAAFEDPPHPDYICISLLARCFLHLGLDQHAYVREVQRISKSFPDC